MNFLKQFGSSLLDFFIPNECILCKTPLVKGEKTLCLACQAKLPRLMGEKSDNLASDKMLGRVKFEHGTSFCFYRKGGDFANLIVSAKYHDKAWINRDLSALFATELQGVGWPFDIDMIVPVPVHFYRKFLRGYNQAEAIAEGLRDVWNLPIALNVLKKSAYATSQVGHTREERLSLMNSTFAVGNAHLIKGKHVLLVDDVLTTGATLDACMQQLINAGARVSFLTLGMSY